MPNPFSRWTASAVWTLLFAAGLPAGDRIVLKDGLTLSGELDLKETRVVVKQRQRTYHVSRGALLKPEEGEGAPKPIWIDVKQIVPEKPARPTAAISGVGKAEPWDEHGRRAATILDSQRRQSNQIQLIYRLFPTHVETDLLDASWKTNVSLGTVPREVLRKIIRRSIDRTKIVDRVKAVEFLIQAERFVEAGEELAELKGEERTDWKKDVDAVSAKLDRTLIEQALRRLTRIVDAGQFRNAAELEKEIRKAKPPSDLLVRLDGARAALDAAAAGRERLRKVLQTAREALSPQPADPQLLSSAVEEILGRLSPATAARLQPVSSLADQKNATPAGTLALAISGWCLGADLARTDLEESLDLWRQRRLLEQSLLGDEVQLQDRLQRLTQPGAVGKPAPRVDVLAQMVPLIAGPGTQLPIGSPTEVKVEARKFEQPLEYRLMLPPEYDVDRRYPLVVAMCEQFDSPEHYLEFWKQLCLEHGWIVVCPKWKLAEETSWEYTALDHMRFLETLDDVRRRFAVDADRVVVAGHGVGAAAAWDLAASHPDEFAALVAFNSPPTMYAERYTPNLARLPIYVVQGTVQYEPTLAMQREFTKFCDKKYDAIFVEYPQRGFEGFGVELPTIYDWLGRKRRQFLPRTLQAVSARASDKQFYWLKIDAHREQSLVPPELYRRQRFQSATASGSVNDANGVVVRTSGFDELTLRLSPGLVQLDAPNFSVKVNNKFIQRGPVEPDLETVLRNVRRTGDRQRLIWKEIRATRL